MILAGEVGGTKVALGVAAPVVVDPSAPLLGAARWATLAGQASW